MELKLSDILPIVLKYEEKGWTEKTVQCLYDAGFKEWDILFADRDGVGNMSRAFNFHFQYADLACLGDGVILSETYKFTWFLTNVEFPPEMPLSLLSCFDKETAAVHPAFDSEHPHIKTAFGVVPDVPFIEWTAPMVRTSLFEQFGGLDEQMPYWGMDLSFSKKCRDAGYMLKIDGRYRLKHNYLRTNAPEKISLIRRELRSLYDRSTEERLIQVHGENYLAEIWPTHPYVAMNRKKLYP